MTRSSRFSPIADRRIRRRLADIRFEQRVEVKSRIDALIGRTVFEAKRDLALECATSSARCPTISPIARRRPANPSSASPRTAGMGGVRAEPARWSGSRKRCSTRKAERIYRLARRRAGAENFAAAGPGDGAHRTRRQFGRVPRRGQSATGAVGRLKGDAGVMLKRQLWAQLLRSSTAATSRATPCGSSTPIW